MKKYLVGLIFLGLMLGSVPGLWAEAGAQTDTDKLLVGNPWVDRIKMRGVLRVGFDIFRPWSMQTGEGQFIGFDIQVAEALASDLGVAVEFVPTAWDGIIPALLTGRFDILIGSLGITAERSRKVAFTEPYEHSGQSIAASLVSAPGLKSVADFNKKGMVVVAKSGTTSVAAIKKLLPLATLKTFDNEDQTAQELRSGRAQALIASAPYPAELALKNPTEIYLPLTGIITREPCGMALSPRDKDALPALNAWIAARYESQWLQNTWSFWFETLDWEGRLK